ncbi:MAG: serpin family protein [Firmicutes bacterium]|jgi:serpin B|nr:serpin family protein [Bacillota bacterium]
MKWRLWSFVVGAMLMCTVGVLSAFCGGVSAMDSRDVDSIVAGNNCFTFDLYSQLAREDGNLFFSPYSISSALAMTYAGARGETAEQMARVLHFTLDHDKLHPAFSGLTGTFNADGTSGREYQLSVANSLWGQVGYPFLPAFLDVTNKWYRAGFNEVDYTVDENREQARQTINKWVEARTGEKIKDLIQPDDLSVLTRLVLTNAIYFKGKWKTQFNSKDTTTMPFHVKAGLKVDVPMMHQEGRFNYAEDDRVQVLEMPYAGGELAMMILLPKPGHELAELESTLSDQELRSWASRLSQETVEVFLPRFKLERRFVLNEQLQSLGMTDAFDEMAADFSGMAPGRDLYISAVIHKSFVDVNEEGTEAAAATAVVMSGKSLSAQELSIFRADRPFVFFIRDLRSGCILFVGRLVDPRS